MFTVLYKWRIKPDLEDQFVESWSRITEYYRDNAGSFGSRLHKGSDGFWYGYAQWPSSEARTSAFENDFEHPSRAAMVEAIEESFPEVQLEIAADFLVSEHE